MKKLQKNLILIIILGIVVSSFLVGAISVMSLNRVTANDNTQILSGVSKENVTAMNEHYLQTENLVNTMAAFFLDELDSVEELKNDSFLNSYVERMRELAYSIAINNDNIVATYLRFDPKITNPTAGFFISRGAKSNDLSYVAPTDLSAYDTSDTEHVGWYYEPVNKGKAVWLDPYMNGNNGIYMVSYVKPLYVREQLVGIVGIDLDFSKICEVVSGIHTFDTGYAILMDENGEILYSGNHSFNIPQETINKIIDNDDLFLSSFIERQKLYDTSSMKMRNGQYLMIIVPDTELNKERNTMIFTIIVVTIVISAVVVLLITKLLIRLFNISHTDVLTKAENRTAYLEKVNDMDSIINSKERYPFSVIVFDINGLKRINDNFGHASGDKLIVNGYTSIKNAFGKSHIYRIGGDEFVAIVENSVSALIELKVDEFRQAMSESVKECAANPEKAIVSCGMASYDPEKDERYQDTFKRADREMYKDKAKFYEKNPELDRKK